MQSNVGHESCVLFRRSWYWRSCVFFSPVLWTWILYVWNAVCASTRYDTMCAFETGILEVICVLFFSVLCYIWYVPFGRGSWKWFVLYAVLCLETWTTMSPLCCSSNMALKILGCVFTKNMMQQMAPTEKWAGYFFKQPYDESPMLRGKSISYPLLNC